MASRWQRQARRWEVYTRRSLAMADGGPPWHRGLVAIATLVMAAVFGLFSDIPEAPVVALALAFFMTMADLEGALANRLAMLAWSAAAIALGGVASILCRDSQWAFAAVFCPLTFVAGLAAWAGAPFLQATRFGLIVGLLMSTVRELGAWDFLELCLVAVAIAAAVRTLEAVLAADLHPGEFATVRVALFKLRAARPLLWRYALSYMAVAGAAWTLGQVVDQVHPTWLTVSTLVVMWPDAARSYERIVQRMFGTLAGAGLAVGLITVVPNPLVLSAVALSMAFFLPHFVRRNYWLHSALVVVFVLVCLDVSSKSGFTTHVVVERIGDVLLGCVFAMAGTLIAFGPTHRRARSVLP